MKRRTFVLSLLLGISTLFTGLSCYQIYMEKVKKSGLAIRHFLSYALDYEVDMRLKNLGEHYIFSNMSPDESINPGVISFQTEDSVSYIEKTPEYTAKTLRERTGQILQTVLLQSGYPLDINIIDSLLVAELYKEKIDATVGIRYINSQTGEMHDSKPGSPVYEGQPANLILLGLQKETEVQAFYKTSFISIARQEPVSFVLPVFTWLLIVMLLIVYLSKKTVHKVAYVPVSEVKTSGPTPLYQISDCIYYDSVQSKIHHSGKQVIYLPKQPATLFMAFLNAPEYFLSNEQIKESIWEGREMLDYRSQAIKRLRISLESVSELRIENLNRKGYQLKVGIKREERYGSISWNCV